MMVVGLGLGSFMHYFIHELGVDIKGHGILAFGNEETGPGLFAADGEFVHWSVDTPDVVADCFDELESFGAGAPMVVCK